MQSSTVRDDSIQSLRNSGPNLTNGAAGEAKNDLRETANKAGQKVRSFLDNASQSFSNASDTVSSHIQEKPMQSSLMALGLGFVLGALLRRR